MTGTSTKPALTRIQSRNRTKIFAAALEVFSKYGSRGSSLDQVAAQAQMSKQNLLYYFDSKESIFVELIHDLMDLWLEPLASLDPAGDPVDEILGYVYRKLEISRIRPQESRLFANEVLQGAPNIRHILTGELKTLVDEKAAVLQVWINQGKIPDIDPYDLIFSIWATTQHYADFSVQIDLVNPCDPKDTFDKAKTFLTTLYTALLRKAP